MMRNIEGTNYDQKWTENENRIGFARSFVSPFFHSSLELEFLLQWIHADS